jgi:hypothetical protein
MRVVVVVDGVAVAVAVEVDELEASSSDWGRLLLFAV